MNVTILLRLTGGILRCQLFPKVLLNHVMQGVFGNCSEEGFLTAATFLSTYYQKHFLLLQCNP
ncbi:hypothetical protein G5I_03333 [Acromyrmex echinatior]|uniref:Uncharacterized protein n=1 Tax=Acromyrmex echinatior TaxID=103372 RepID=F4WCQ7_ACREC|nr:hypothetical protein G5I_03333 [Acromyrmex echinatior]